MGWSQAIKFVLDPQGFPAITAEMDLTSSGT